MTRCPKTDSDSLLEVDHLLHQEHSDDAIKCLLHTQRVRSNWEVVAVGLWYLQSVLPLNVHLNYLCIELYFEVCIPFGQVILMLTLNAKPEIMVRHQTFSNHF